MIKVCNFSQRLQLHCALLTGSCWKYSRCSYLRTSNEGMNRGAESLTSCKFVAKMGKRKKWGRRESHNSQNQFGKHEAVLSELYGVRENEPLGHIQVKCPVCSPSAPAFSFWIIFCGIWAQTILWSMGGLNPGSSWDSTLLAILRLPPLKRDI